jgi:hypothetical protein
MTMTMRSSSGGRGDRQHTYVVRRLLLFFRRVLIVYTRVYTGLALKGGQLECFATELEE